ncbi:MAG: tetraacyldisaccharide 4'-kinase [Deltaproteobacteria bacterium]|nr:tetraacyldisaccharide 4'-kinase [Deltaproteobacteria bacterium]
MGLLRKKIESVMLEKSGARVGAPERAGLWLLSQCYGAGIAVRNGLYRQGLCGSRKLPCRVISIGNLTVGGTGKTPMAIDIVQRLRGLGVPVAVISRGYGGRRQKAGGIVSDGKQIRMSAREAGDEPVLMAERLRGVPVLVGKDRYRVGMAAIERFGVQVLVLDDAFQYLAVHRDWNLVLLDGARPFGNGHLLPRGPLREPISSLRRADTIVLTRCDGPRMTEQDQQRLRHLAAASPVFHCRHVVEGVVALRRPQSRMGRAVGRLSEGDPGALNGRRVLAFSGIVGNRAFQEMVSTLGCRMIQGLSFPDHHQYTNDDLEAILKSARRGGCDVVVTTEKDLVRIGERASSWPIEVLALRIKISFGREEGAFQGALSERVFRGLSV